MGCPMQYIYGLSYQVYIWLMTENVCKGATYCKSNVCFIFVESSIDISSLAYSFMSCSYLINKMYQKRASKIHQDYILSFLIQLYLHT